MRAVIILGLGAILSACSAPVDIDKVKAEIAAFREKQAANRDEAIYTDASQSLRDVASLDDIKRLEDVVRAAIARGCAAPSADPTNWNVNYGTGGEIVTLTYSRSCTTGELDETFTYRIENQKPMLSGYHVNGMALFPPTPDAAKPTAPADAAPTTPAPPSTTPPTAPSTAT